MAHRRYVRGLPAARGFAADAIGKPRGVFVECRARRAGIQHPVRGSRKWIVVAAAASAAIAIAFLAPRGGSSNALADAAGRMEGENMRVELVMGMTDSSGEYSFAAEGVVAADNSSGELNATGDFDGEKVHMVVRNIGDRFWTRFPQLRHVMPPGKRWVSMVDRSTPATSLTPSEWARFLAEADHVDEVSDDERIRGQLTTHYSGVVDVEELADEIGGESKERIEAAIEQEDPEPGQKVGLPVEAWISRDGLPLRMRVYVNGSPDSFDARADILEYGVPVEVEPPPENTVIDEAEFNRLVGG